MSHGAQALSDSELLAVLLGNGRRGRNVVELAGELLAEHGGLTGLAAARPEELSRRSGVGTAKAAAVVAAFQLAIRAQGAMPTLPRLDGGADIARVAFPLFTGARVERLLVLVCDTQGRMRRTVFVAQGAIDGVDVPVREILNTVLRHDGKAFAVVHNHPSGEPMPSWDDIQVTRSLASAARIVGLRFIDHVVVAGDRWASAGGAGDHAGFGPTAGSVNC